MGLEIDMSSQVIRNVKEGGRGAGKADIKRGKRQQEQVEG